MTDIDLAAEIESLWARRAVYEAARNIERREEFEAAKQLWRLWVPEPTKRPICGYTICAANPLANVHYLVLP